VVAPPRRPPQLNIICIRKIARCASMFQLALKRPYTFIVMAMLIVLATPFALLRMATDIFPEINIPVISIVWNYGGLSAQQMGQRITAQNERSLTTTVSDIEHIESRSLAGIAIIKIFFQPTANIQTAIAQVVIEQAQLRQPRRARRDAGRRRRHHRPGRARPRRRPVAPSGH
jgi:multidrug efflux pump subunit AcrB